MALIKKKKLQYQGYWHEVGFHCNSEGKFFAKLPGYIAEELGVDADVWGDTLIECEKRYQDIVDRHTDVRSEKSKVILYSLNNAIIRESDGCEINMWAGVFIERKVMLHGTITRYTYEFVESSIPKRMAHHARSDYYRTGCPKRTENLLEWTQEREDFFADLGARFEAMMMQIKEFQKPERLLILLDSKTKLLS